MQGRVADGNKEHDMGEGREGGHHNSTPSYLLCHEKRTLNTGPGNTAWCKKKSFMFKFPALLPPTNLGLPMHSSLTIPH